MKILNIDALVQPRRQLTFAGKSYPVKEMDVQKFIDSLADAEVLEAEVAAGDIATGKQIKKNVEGAVAAIYDAVPGLKEDNVQVMSWPIDAMTTVLNFIRGDYDKGDGVTEGESAEKKST